MPTPRVEAAQVTWTAQGHPSGSTCASDIGLAPGEVPHAIDVVSARTGEAEVFRYSEPVTNRGGETVGWRYARGTSTVTVWND